MRRGAGFTLFEFAVVCAVVGVLAAVLLGRLRDYDAEAERASVARLIGNLRAAIQFRANVRVAGGGESELRRLAEANPLDFIGEKPGNYLGEYYSPDLHKLPGGNWLFDRRDKTLVYLWNNPQNALFYNANFLKFKVELFPMASSAGGRDAGASRSRLEIVSVGDVFADEIAGIH